MHFIKWVVQAGPGGGFVVPIMTSTPIGCSTTHDLFTSSTEEHCSVWWKLEEDPFSHCPFTKTTEDHHMCGVNATGFTYTKLMNTGQYNAYLPYDHLNHYTDMFDPTLGYHVSVNVHFGMKLIMPTEAYDAPYMFEASFGPVSTDHSLWNNYKIPNLKVGTLLHFALSAWFTEYIYTNFRTINIEQYISLKRKNGC